MIRKILSLILAAVLLTGCAAPTDTISKKRYQASFLTLFDTVTSIVGYAETEEEFKSITDEIHDQLELYHQLFDIYNDYEGINNIKTINDLTFRHNTCTVCSTRPLHRCSEPEIPATKSLGKLLQLKCRVTTVAAVQLTYRHSIRACFKHHLCNIMGTVFGIF